MLGTWLSTVVASAFVALAATSGLAAQTPAAGRAPAAPGSLTGAVRDVGGSPLPGVTVTLLGEPGATRTDTAGAFTLSSVPAGGHTALFRRIGYQSIQYRWTSRPGRVLQIAVSMTPAPQRLGPTVVEAPMTSRRRGTSSIGGTISDSAGHPVVGADVRLLGAGLSTVTDNSGAFEFRMLAAGSYIVRARLHGLAPVTSVTQVAADDDHATTLKMYGLPVKTARGDTAEASGFGAVDVGFEAFDRREQSSIPVRVLGPADLFRADRAPLDFLLAQYRDPSRASKRTLTLGSEGAGTGAEADGDCLLINGRRTLYQPLGTFTSVEVLLVEVFPKNSMVDEYLLGQMDALPECRGSMDRHPPYFALWTRSLR